MKFLVYDHEDADDDNDVVEYNGNMTMTYSHPSSSWHIRLLGLDDDDDDNDDDYDDDDDDGEDIFEEAFVNGENGIDIDVDDCETSLKFLMMMTTSLKFSLLPDAIEVMFVS